MKEIHTRVILYGPGDECVWKMKKINSHKAEFILLLGLFLVGAVLAMVLFLTMQEGACVEVRVSGELVESYPLGHRQSVEITGANGGKNLLMIEDGSAWIESADCPDGLCCGMGRIRFAGQSVVCLPHQVVVEIRGQTRQTEDVDMVAG